MRARRRNQPGPGDLRSPHARAGARRSHRRHPREPQHLLLRRRRIRAASGDREEALARQRPSGRPRQRDLRHGGRERRIRRDLPVITDEIYEYIRYDGRRHVSPASIAGLQDRTVTIMGLSKTFSITGWRLGYTFAPAELTRAITLVNDLYFVCAPTPLQLGAARGFDAPRSYFEDLMVAYRKKRDRICAALDRARLPPIVPEGAYYVLADCTRLGFATSVAAAMHVLETTQVASVAASAFYRGAEGERLLRFCFAKDDAVLEEACSRLATLR